MVPPLTQAVCLGVLIDTVAGTISIPAEKLMQVKEMVKNWTHMISCMKCQLQSLLGLLLYIHKCVKPARCFLNRMLDVLRRAQNLYKIKLDDDFHRDLLWFSKFLDVYNVVSPYDHRPINATLELDACLTGIGSSLHTNCSFCLVTKKCQLFIWKW